MIRWPRLDRNPLPMRSLPRIYARIGPIRTGFGQSIRWYSPREFTTVFATILGRNAMKLTIERLVIEIIAALLLVVCVTAFAAG
jgi:hypothetical protein